MKLETYLDRRFICNGHFGTVCYVGPLPGTEDLWLGVEWDDQTRGKHDGTFNGKKYFNTRFRTSGSFIRPHKAKFGISYHKAVCEQYGQKPSSDEETSSTYVIQSSCITKPIEVLGMDKIIEKQSRFHELKTICLNTMNVNGIDENNDLTDFTPNVHELDLSKNLLSTWTDVANIIQYLKKLRILDISGNKLKLTGINKHLKESFEMLTELRMASMGYKWDDVQVCGRAFPQIKNLFLPFNEIKRIETPDVGLLQHLEFLELNSNHIGDWKELLKLAFLPRLKILHVNNCGIDSVIFPDCEPGEKTKFFAQLEILRLSDNNCSKWTDISELHKLQNLIELRMDNNPVCEMYSYETTRQLFIAHIGLLKMLNRVEITHAERRGAELDYLKKYGQIWLDIAKSGSTEKRLDFLREHPRYLELINRHGETEESELGSQQRILKTKLFDLEIISPVCDKKFKKRLPSTMTIQKLKRLLQQLYKVNHQDLQISYTFLKDTRPVLEFIFHDDQEDLAFYSVEDGGRITVTWE